MPFILNCREYQGRDCGSDHNGSDHNGSDHNGSDHNGSDHNGSDHNVSDHNGSDHNGSDHNGSDHNGSDHNGSEHNGSEHNGSEHNGSDHNGSDHNGSDHNGSDHNGSDHNGSDHNGPDHNGSDHNGSDHKGSDHNGSGHNGSGHNGSDHHGSDHNGSEHNGSDHNGSDLSFACLRLRLTSTDESKNNLCTRHCRILSGCRMQKWEPGTMITLYNSLLITTDLNIVMTKYDQDNCRGHHCEDTYTGIADEREQTAGPNDLLVSQLRRRGSREYNLDSFKDIPTKFQGAFISLQSTSKEGFTFI